MKNLLTAVILGIVFAGVSLAHTSSEEKVVEQQAAKAADVKVAVVVHSTGRGGAEHVAGLWIARLCKRGHEVTLFGTDAPEPPELAQYGQPVHEWVPPGARLVELASPGDGHVAKVRRLRRELEEGEFDVCLAMQTYPSLLTLTAARAARRRTPVVVSERSVPSMLLKRQGRSQRLQLAVARRLYRAADAAIAISHPVAADLISSFHIDPATQHRFLNGLDDVGITMTHADEITDYEANRPAWLP